MRGRWALVAAAVASVLVVPAARAATVPDQGWWTTLQPAGAPDVPPPPDVAPDDLLLQGGDAARALPDTGVVGRAPAPTAVAALRFVLRPGEGVDRLVLEVAAGAQAADVRAYRTTSPAWAPARGGPMAAAPAPDLTRYATGALSPDGTSLVFGDVGRLAGDDGVLSVVLVPGPLDRVVVHRLGPTALVTSGGSLSDCFCPPPLPPTSAPGLPVPAPPALGAPVALGPPPAVPAVPAPVAAPAPVAQAAAPAARAAARVVADDGRTRLVLGLEALLLLVFFGLLGQGPLGALARVTGQPAEVRTARGVGRFARERTGRPARL